MLSVYNLSYITACPKHLDIIILGPIIPPYPITTPRKMTPWPETIEEFMIDEKQMVHKGFCNNLTRFNKKSVKSRYRWRLDKGQLVKTSQVRKFRNLAGN